MTATYKAIVLGSGVTALGVIRNLGRQGIKIVALTDKDNFSMHSKYISTARIVPHLRSDPEMLLIELQRIVQNNPGTRFCLLPCSDEHLVAIGQIRHKLPECIQTNQANLETLNLFLNKWKFYSLLDELKLAYPKSFFPKDPSDLDTFKHEINYPVFIKPLYSHLFRKIFVGQKGFSAYNIDQLRNYLKKCFAVNIDVMISEIVPGNSDDHYFIDGYVDKAGELKTVFTRKRLHMYPLDFGNSTSMVSIPTADIQPAIDELKILLKHLDYRGIFSLEVKHDAISGTYKMLDLNGRSWWYAIFPSMCGVNIIEMAFNDVLDIPYNKNGEFVKNRHFMYFWPEIKSLISMYKNKRLGFFEAIKAFRFSFNYPIFAIDDPKPLICRAQHWFKAKFAYRVSGHE